MITQIRYKITEIRERGFVHRRQTRQVFGEAGQSLAELAIFASIFLFVLSVLVQYGLRMNYQQESDMVVFRKALSEAVTLAVRGQASQVVTVEDKDFPDVVDTSGMSYRHPIVSNAGVTWSTDLMGDFTKSDLPRMKLDINGEEIVGASGELQTAGERPVDTHLGFSGFSSLNGKPIPDHRRVLFMREPTEVTCENPNLPDDCVDMHVSEVNKDGRSWKWVKKDKAFILGKRNQNVDGHCVHPGDDRIYKDIYVKMANERLLNKMAEVDPYGGDGWPFFKCTAWKNFVCVRWECEEDKECNEELIIKVNVSYYPVNPPNSDCCKWNSPDGCENWYFVYSLTVFDFDQGDIDLTYDDRDIAAGRPMQGIQPGYAKDISSKRYLRREENYPEEPDAIRTVDAVDETQTITRNVILNPGPIEHQSEFKEQRAFEWLTPNN